MPGTLRRESRPDPTQLPLGSVFGRLWDTFPSLRSQQLGWWVVTGGVPPEQHLPVPSPSWVTRGAMGGAVLELPPWGGRMEP